MKRHRFFGCIIVGALLYSPFSIQAGNPPSQESLMRKRVLSDLDSIQNIFEVQYAPLKWKQEFANWEIGRAIEEAKNKINTLSSPDLKSCQVIMKDFFNTARDYHVGINYYSTERAYLPFIVKGAHKRYFVCYVDRDQVNYQQFPFEVGDEILTFDDRPVDEVIQEVRIREFGLKTLETDQALAELTLTFRQGELGQDVPRGPVKVVGKSKERGTEISCVLRWNYTPEKIHDFSKLGFHVATHIGSQEWQNNVKSALKRSQFLDKYMISYLWDKSHAGSSSQMDQHSLGCHSSYIPPLGEIMWEPSLDAFFDAYIFRTPSSKKIGYIRIPHYLGDKEEVEEFGEIMNFFQYYTDALVIDQINNPGGSLFYMYGLTSTLIDYRCHTPKHHIALTQEEVNVALDLLFHLKDVRDDSTAQEVLGETLGGYPIDYEFAQLTSRYCNFIIDQWVEGNLYTDSTFLFGFNELKPHPYYRYSKPILLLVNSLDFSGGDFFPAIMKDNKRATILGTRTAGAGGYVISTAFPNHSGIKNFLLTASFSERINHKPIENLGVEPDIFYELTPTDLQENYQEYVSTIVEAVESLAEKG